MAWSIRRYLLALVLAVTLPLAALLAYSLQEGRRQALTDAEASALRISQSRRRMRSVSVGVGEADAHVDGGRQLGFGQGLQFGEAARGRAQFRWRVSGRSRGFFVLMERGAGEGSSRRRSACLDTSRRRAAAHRHRRGAVMPTPQDGILPEPGAFAYFLT